MDLPNPIRRHQWSVAEGIRGNFNILLVQVRRGLISSFEYSDSHLIPGECVAA